MVLKKPRFYAWLSLGANLIGSDKNNLTYYKGLHPAKYLCSNSLYLFIESFLHFINEHPLFVEEKVAKIL